MQVGNVIFCIYLVLINDHQEQTGKQSFRWVPTDGTNEEEYGRVLSSTCNCNLFINKGSGDEKEKGKKVMKFLRRVYFIVEKWDQYQYLGNCPPTPPVTQQQSIDNKLGLMLG